MKPRYTADTMYCCTHTLAAPDKACHKFRIVVADLENTVLKLLQERANSAALDTPMPAFTATGEKMAIVEEEKRRLYEQLAEGTLSATEFSAANDVLTHRLTELRRTQEAVAAQADKRAFAQAAAPMKGKRKPTTAVVDALIQKVRVYPDGEIAVNWIEKSLPNKGKG